MRKFEDSIRLNTPYEGSITDYSEVEYDIKGEKVTFYTNTLRKDLIQAGYSGIEISLILEAIHHSDGARHSRIKVVEPICSLNMKLYEKVGNITVYTKHFTSDNSIEVKFFNGSDIVASDTYFNSTSENAVADLFSKTLDVHTESFVYSIFLEKHSQNTFQTNELDWFCRIDDTKYFKHFNKAAAEFTRDKGGLRIIDL